MNYLHLVPWSPRTTFGGYETIIRDAARKHSELGFGATILGRRNDSHLSIERHIEHGVEYVEYVDPIKRRPSTLDVGVLGFMLLIFEIIYTHIVLTPLALWIIWKNEVDVVIFYGIHLFLMSPILRLFGVTTLLGLEVIQKNPHTPRLSLLHIFRTIKYACFSGVFTYTKTFRYGDGTSIDNVKLLESFVGKKRILYLPWGIDLVSVKGVKLDEDIQKLKREKKKVIICPRRLVEEKGVRYLLEAIPLMRAKNPKVIAIFAGDGVLRPELEKRAKVLGITSHVQFTGFVPHEKSLSMIKSADVVVVPSSGEESFGMVFLESYALGTPIVTTWFGGITNVVADGKSGIVVDPKDPQALSEAIMKLLTDTSYAKQLVDNGETLVKTDYNLTTTLTKLDAFARTLH